MGAIVNVALSIAALILCTALIICCVALSVLVIFVVNEYIMKKSEERRKQVSDG